MVLIGKLNMIYFDHMDPDSGRKKWDVYMGTGFLVGGKYVFTAGHNVFYYPNHPSEPWAYPDLIEFYPGFSEGKFFMNGQALNEPVEDHHDRDFIPRANIVTVHHKWKKEEYSDHHENPYDFAGIILDREIESPQGYFHPKHHTNEDLMQRIISVTGCPGGDKNGDMYTMSGKIMDINEWRVHYDVHTSGGQSGSPVWYSHEDGRSVCTAVHIGAHHGKMNTGTRLNPLLLKYIEEEWSIRLGKE